MFKPLHSVKSTTYAKRYNELTEELFHLFNNASFFKLKEARRTVMLGLDVLGETLVIDNQPFNLREEVMRISNFAGMDYIREATLLTAKMLMASIGKISKEDLALLAKKQLSKEVADSYLTPFQKAMYLEVSSLYTGRESKFNEEYFFVGYFEGAVGKSQIIEVTDKETIKRFLTLKQHSVIVDGETKALYCRKRKQK